MKKPGKPGRLNQKPVPNSICRKESKTTHKSIAPPIASDPQSDPHRSASSQGPRKEMVPVMRRTGRTVFEFPPRRASPSRSGRLDSTVNHCVKGFFLKGNICTICSQGPLHSVPRDPPERRKISCKRHWSFKETQYNKALFDGSVVWVRKKHQH